MPNMSAAFCSNSHKWIIFMNPLPKSCPNHDKKYCSKCIFYEKRRVKINFRNKCKKLGIKLEDVKV